MIVNLVAAWTKLWIEYHVVIFILFKWTVKLGNPTQCSENLVGSVLTNHRGNILKLSYCFSSVKLTISCKLSSPIKRCTLYYQSKLTACHSKNVATSSCRLQSLVFSRNPTVNAVNIWSTNQPYSLNLLCPIMTVAFLLQSSSHLKQ